MFHLRQRSEFISYHQLSYCFLLHIHDNCLPHQNSPSRSSPQETNCAWKKMYSEREPLTVCTGGTLQSYKRPTGAERGGCAYCSHSVSDSGPFLFVLGPKCDPGHSCVTRSARGSRSAHVWCLHDVPWSGHQSSCLWDEEQRNKKHGEAIISSGLRTSRVEQLSEKRTMFLW